MSDTVIHLPTAFGNSESVTFSTPFNEGNRVEVEITARQKSDPVQGATGIYVIWDVCRGLAEVNPILTRIKICGGSPLLLRIPACVWIVSSPRACPICHVHACRR